MYELQWSVNRFTEQSFLPYTGGVWLKDRSYTENTWENIHMMNAGSDGSVSITFHGMGYDGVSVHGKNTRFQGGKLKLEIIENNSEGNVFNLYTYLPDNNLQLIQSTSVPSHSLEPYYTLNIEEGWYLRFATNINYLPGDYWNITVTQRKCIYPSNYSQPRGLLKKVNTLRIRLVEKVTRKVVQQEVKIIGFGIQPHGHHLLFTTADSSDVIEVLSVTENDDIRENVYLHILNPDGLVEFEGVVEWDKAAGSSACLPNTSVAFKARGELGPKNMTTSIYGIPGEKVDKIKFRVGGSMQYLAYSSHEIALRIFNDQNLALLGGVQNSVATWYLNGSYWSLGFPQEQPRKRFFGRILGVDKEDIDIISVMSEPSYYDSLVQVIHEGMNGWFLYLSEELENAENPIFIPEEYINLFLVHIRIFDSIKNKFQIIGTIQDGETDKVTYYAQKILNILNQLKTKSVDVSLEKLSETIDVDIWLKYISFIHFTSLNDIISNNNIIGVSPKNKIFPIITDFDAITIQTVEWVEIWEFIFNHSSFTSNKSYLFELILNLIHSSPSAMNRLALVYQDLLNTALLPERTVAIVNEMRDLVMPHYEEYHLSWGGSPNGGQSPEGQKQLYNNLVQFYSERPEYAFQLMADYIMPDEAFVLEDRNLVNIVFDSIPQGIVEVKFNSLTLYENFSGLYFPKPEVDVSYTVKEGFDVTIKEYPERGTSFLLGADSTLNITFVLKKD